MLLAEVEAQVTAMVRTLHWAPRVVQEEGATVLQEGPTAATAYMLTVATVLAGRDGRLAALQAWALAHMVLRIPIIMAVPAEGILVAGAEPFRTGVVAAAAVLAT